MSAAGSPPPRFHGFHGLQRLGTVPMADMTQAVANRYVTALADVLMQPDSGVTPEQALEQIQEFGDVLAQSSDLDSVLRSPAVSPREKRGIVAAIGERIGLARVIQNFLYVVVDHRRIGHFDLLLQSFRAWLDQIRNHVEVEVRVAEWIGDDQKAVLEQRFRELTGMQVRPAYVLDSSLLGGASVQIGSMLYDGSLRASLGSLAASLTSVNS